MSTVFQWNARLSVWPSREVGVSYICFGAEVTHRVHVDSCHIRPTSVENPETSAKQNPQAQSTQDAHAQRNQTGPVDVNGGVHTAHNQHQRICVRICARASSVDWAAQREKMKFLCSFVFCFVSVFYFYFILFYFILYFFLTKNFDEKKLNKVFCVYFAVFVFV